MSSKQLFGLSKVFPKIAVLSVYLSQLTQLLITPFLFLSTFSSPALAQAPQPEVELAYQTASNEFSLQLNHINQTDVELTYQTNNSEVIEAISDSLLASNQKISKKWFAGTRSTGESDEIRHQVTNGTLALKAQDLNNQTFLYQADFKISNQKLWLQEDSIWSTFQLESGVNYLAPQNEKVQLKFTSLPENMQSYQLNIAEIKLSPEQQIELGALSDTAYEITSNLTNGTFAYDLTLPNPQPSKNVQVKYSEDGQNYSNAGTIEKNNDTITISGLNHFTTFIVVDDGSGNYIDDGWNEHPTNGYDGDHHWVNPTQLGSQAVWTFPGTAGYYQVYLSWTVNDNHDQNAHYTSDFVLDLTTNQEKMADGSEAAFGTWSDWFDAGTYYVENGEQVFLTVEATTTDNIVADAIKFEPLPTGMMQGRTFIDQNNNGLLLTSDGDYPDQMTDGFQVRLYDSSWNQIASTVTTSNTGEPGQFRFDDLLANNQTYRVCPVTKIGFAHAMPSNGQTTVDVSNNPTPASYAQGLVVPNGSGQADEASSCWQATLNDQDAGWLGMGYQSLDTLTEPQNLGYNVKNSASDAYATPHPDTEISCGGATNINGVSHHWTTVSTDPLVKYQRQYQTPGNSNWSGNEIYTNNYTNFRTFGGGSGNPGTYNSQVRAFYDLNGNNQVDAYESTSAWSSNNCYITYDIKAPAAPNLISPLNNAFVTGDVLTSVWSSVSDAAKYIYHSYHNAAATNLRWSHEYTTTSKTATKVADAIFWWKVRAVDEAGNESGWSPLWKITVDNTAPLVNFDTPASDPVTIKGSYDIYGSVNETNLSHYNFSIYDGGADFMDFGSRKYSDTQYLDTGFNNQLLYTWNTNDGNWPDGDYLIRLAARDKAGNRDLSQDPYSGGDDSQHVLTITVDNTAPATPSGLIRKDPAGNIYNCSDFAQRVNMVPHWNANTEPDFDHYEYSSFHPGDIQGLDEKVLTTTSLPNTWVAPTDGTYGFAVRAVDKVGNKSGWAISDENLAGSCQITYDSQAPSSTITTFNLADEGEEETNDFDGLIEGTATDHGGSGVNHVLLSVDYLAFGDDLLDTQYWDATASAWTTTPSAFRANGQDTWNYQLPDVPEGTYTITSHAVDNVGNVESTYQIKIVFDKTIPQVTVTTSPASPDGVDNWFVSEPVITLTGSDNYQLDHLEYQWGTTAGTWTTYSSPLTPPSTGQHLLYYRGVDQVGNMAINQIDIGLKEIKYDPTKTASSTSTDSSGASSSDSSSATYSCDAAQPGDISNLRVQSTGANSITLAWNTATNATNYNLFFTDTVSGTKYGANDIGPGPYTLGNLVVGRQYLIEVFAENDCQPGNSTSLTASTNRGGAVIGGPTAGGQPAGEILGTDTEQEAAITDEAASTQQANGEVKGASTACQNFNWWWLALIIQVAGLVILFIFTSDAPWIRVGVGIAISAFSTFLLWRWLCTPWIWMLIINGLAVSAELAWRYLANPTKTIEIKPKKK